MEYKNISFFNIEEILEDGTLLRFKKNLINNLGCDIHHRGRFYAYRAIGSEIRFKTKASFFEITLEAYKEECKVYVFFGDFFYKEYSIVGKKTLHIDKVVNVFNENIKSEIYNKDVIRILIGYSGYIKFIDLNTFGYDIEKVLENDLPSKTLLIYGSSISHGSEALSYVNSYAYLLSRLLKCDVINKAIPGSCQAEYEMIDYLKTLKYDKCFIEYGVNVYQLFDIDTIKDRFLYIVKNIKNLYLTSVMDNGSFYISTESRKNIEEIREFVNSLNANIIDYNGMLSVNNLTCDLLHPSNFGQLEIALKIYNHLKEEF